MPFEDEELSDIVEEIRNDANYLSKTDSILSRCAFRHIDDKKFDDIAVDNLTERELQFSILGRVVRKTTFLQPEGSFRYGIYPTKRDESTALLNTRLRVSLAPPRDVLDTRLARHDWARYQLTLKQLIASAVGQKDGAQHWSPYRKDKNVFMLSHLLISNREAPFDLRPGNQGKTREHNVNSLTFTSSPSGEIGEDPIEEADHTGPPDQQINPSAVEQHMDKLMRIKDWPASAEWHTVADQCDATHFINPLPAFDDEYELVMPRAYEANLLGAVVHARFTLSRFDIRGDHVFVCNIVELQVLKPPTGGADVRKRRTLMDLVVQKKRKRCRII